MISPHLQGEALTADIEDAPDDPGEFHVWWLGQSGFLLKWNRHRLVFDPYLSDSLTAKYHDSEKPHVRMTELALEPARLGRIEVVTSSHTHTDHLDAATLGPLLGANPSAQLVLPEANVELATERLGGPASGAFRPLDAGTSVTVGPFDFTGIPAAHNKVTTDEDGHHLFLGFVVTFGKFTVYHSGDTLWHPGLLPALAAHPGIDLAFVPINGNRPERGVAGNLNGTEAAAVARAAGAALAVPHHFEMFEFNTESPDEFEHACARLGQPYQTLRCGERLTVRPRTKSK